MGVLEPHQILSSHFIYHSGKSWCVSLDSVEKALIITLKVNYLCYVNLIVFILFCSSLYAYMTFMMILRATRTIQSRIWLFCIRLLTDTTKHIPNDLSQII